MIRLRRASVSVVLSLLASTATAHAECAWVMWRIEHGAKNDAAIPFEGHATLSDCQARANSEDRMQPDYLRRKDEGDGMARKQGVSEHLLLPRHAYFWRCLPDTVDPRGQKAGMRARKRGYSYPCTQGEEPTITDIHLGLRRAAAILAALDAHEANITKADDVKAVAAERFALLDGARRELAALVVPDAQ